MAAKVSTIYINCTNIIRAELRDRITGSPVDTGTGTLEIKKRDGTQISGGSFTLTKVPAVSGLWQVTIPASFTSNLQENETYLLCLTFSKDLQQVYAEQNVRAVKLKIS